MEFKKISEDPVLRLKDVFRWSNKFLIRKEDVGMHVVDMIGISLRIVGMVNALVPDILAVDKKDVIYRIAIHDLDESVSCDLPRPFKYATKEFKEAVDKVTDILLNKSYSPTLVREIHESKSHEKVEGVIVQICDILQASVVLRNECINLGNRGLIDSYQDNLEYVKEYAYEIETFNIAPEYKEILTPLMLGFYTELTEELKKVNVAFSSVDLAKFQEYETKIARMSFLEDAVADLKSELAKLKLNNVKQN